MTHAATHAAPPQSLDAQPAAVLPAPDGGSNGEHDDVDDDVDDDVGDDVNDDVNDDVGDVVDNVSDDVSDDDAHGAGARRLDALALRAQRGEPGARAELVEKLLKRLRPLVSHLIATRSRDVFGAADVDDVLQDIVVFVWQQDLHRFDPARSGFLTYVSRRLRWHVADLTRAARRRAADDLDDAEFGEVADCRSDPEALLEARRGEDMLLSLPETIAAADIDAQALLAVQLYDLQGASLADVARQLQVHISNACRARQRGLKLLARQLMLAA